MTLYTRFAAHIDAALDTLVAAGDLPADLSRANVTLEPPRDITHGDLATNAAKRSRRTWKRSTRFRACRSRGRASST
jgi:arginyl-tRNA synthetase